MLIKSNKRTCLFKTISIEILCLLLSLSGCSTKSKPDCVNCRIEMKAPNECGAGTIAQGTIMGTIVGGIAGQLSQVNPIISAVVGGVIGATGGYKLASMQCQYQGKEHALLRKIQKSIRKQNGLASKSEQLNRKISQLYQEIETVNSNENESFQKRESLRNKIIMKKEEIISIQSLNNNVISKTENYYSDLKTRNYSKTDKESIKHSLSSILISLNSIKDSCTYNLEQLKKFEKKVE